jgi:hypothetical protein
MIARRKLPFIAIFCFSLLVTGLSAQTLQVIDREGHATTLDATQMLPCRA